jgi:hypothetical protein
MTFVSTNYEVDKPLVTGELFYNGPDCESFRKATWTKLLY